MVLTLLLLIIGLEMTLSTAEPFKAVILHNSDETCQNADEYVLVRIKAQIHANLASAVISLYNVTIWESGSFKDYSSTDIGLCLPFGEAKYSLELRSKRASGWEAGTTIGVYGYYSNELFRGFLHNSTYKLINFRQGYLIPLESKSWKYSSVEYEGWMSILYDDNDWANYQWKNKSMLVLGTEYYRQVFSGYDDSAAYEITVRVRCGIIVYLNANEIFRLNMPSGPVSISTPSSYCYDEPRMIHIIRSAEEISITLLMIAVELHYPPSVSYHPQVFDVWFASYDGDSYSNCYFAVNGLSVVANHGNNTQALFDFDYSTFFDGSVEESAITIDIYSHDYYYNYNTFVYYNYRSIEYTPTKYDLIVYNQTSHKETFVSKFNVKNKPHTYSISKCIYNTEVSNHYTAVIYETKSGRLRTNLLRFLVCKSEVPAFIPFKELSYAGYANVTYISIAPTMDGVYDCVMESPLPSGLILNSISCTISGIPHYVDEVFIVVRSTRTGLSGIVSLSTYQCMGTIVEVQRTYGNAPENELFSIYEGEGTLLYEELPYSSQASYEMNSFRLCVMNKTITLHMSCVFDYSWSIGSIIDVYEVVMIERFERIQLLHTTMNNQLLLHNTVTLDVAMSIPFMSSWLYSTTLSPSWYNTQAWGDEHYLLKAYGTYPTSPNQFQFYRHYVTLDHEQASTIVGFRLFMMYVDGIEIYINNNRLFINHLDCDLSVSCYASSQYGLAYYRELYSPNIYYISSGTQLVVYFHEGVNSINIVLVDYASVPKKPVFDGGLLFITQPKFSYGYDFTVSKQDIDIDVSSLFAIDSKDFVYCADCSPTSSIIISFVDDKRVWINTITLIKQTTSLAPVSFGILGRIDTVSEWVTLEICHDWVWWDDMSYKTVTFNSFDMYNEYKIVGFATGSDADSNRWNLQHIGLSFEVDLANTVSLYPENVVFYKNAGSTLFFPSNPLYHSFMMHNPLPKSFSYDVALGVIIGNPTETVEPYSIMISATYYTGASISFYIKLSVIECYDSSHSLVRARITLGFTNQPLLFYLYKGRNITSTPEYTINGLIYQSLTYTIPLCLVHGIYTVAPSRIDNTEWHFPNGFSILVDQYSFALTGCVISSTATPNSVAMQFSSYIPFVAGYSQWRVLYLAAAVPEHWLLYDFDDSLWPVAEISIPFSSSKSVAYFRYKFSIPNLIDYRVLYVKVRFHDGLRVFLNSNLVASFNYPTITPRQDPTKWSSFSVLLAEDHVGHLNNILCIEEINVSDHVFVIDITGSFCIMDVCPLHTSYSVVDHTQVESGINQDLLKMLDIDPLSFYTFRNDRTLSIYSVFENLVPLRYNGALFILDRYIYPSTWTLMSRHYIADASQNNTEWIEMVNEGDTKIYDSVANVLSLPLANIGSRVHYITMDTSFAATDYIHISILSPSYTFPSSKSASEGRLVICESLGDFASVRDGGISTCQCPPHYTGYAYRICNEGVFSEIIYEHCIMKAPHYIDYGNKNRIVFYQSVKMASSLPKSDEIVTTYYLENDTVLPTGLYLDGETGRIYGACKSSEGEYMVIISAENSSGRILQSVTIIINRVYCKDSRTNKVYAMNAIIRQNCPEGHYGREELICKGSELGGEWNALSVICINKVVVIITTCFMCILFLVLLRFVMDVVSATFHRQRARKLGDKMYSSSHPNRKKAKQVVSSV